MPLFRYETVGGQVSATIEAPDRSAAVRRLLREGLTPVRIEPVNGLTDGLRASSPADAASRDAAPARVGPDRRRRRTAGPVLRSAMSRGETATFLRELSTAVQAGLPLVTALRTIAKQGRSTRQRLMLEHLIDQVEHGRSLADAAENWGKPFTELIVSLIRAGETSGNLEVVLVQSAELADRDLKLRRAILGATLYPMMLAALIAVAVVIVVTVIVPRVLKAVEGQVVQLPLPTRIVQALAEFIGGYWWAIVPAVLAALFVTRRVYAHPPARLWIDRHLLRLPVLGRVLRDVAVARFTRTLGTLTASGIGALSALRVTKKTLGNRAMEAVVDEVCAQVTSGRTIADPMERSGLFPPLLVQVVNMGERSGRLDEMLRQAADAFDDRTEMSIKLLMTVIPPALVVCLACVVGFIILAILLPLLQLQESLS